MSAIHLCILSLVLPSHVLAVRKNIDLSYTYDNTTLTWPTEQKERFRFTKREKYDSPHYEANSFAVAEHSGTHIDAPQHFSAGKYGVAKIPISDLIGQSVVVNVTEKAKRNPDLLIGISDLENNEKEFGRIPEAAIVLLFSGWGKHWPNATAYFGTATNNTAILHFPGLDPAAATWLIQNRKVKAIGIDTASIDYGQSKNFTTHRILMGNNVPVFENVANLNLVPARDAMVYALPMKIGEGTGAPLRIIATWDDSKKTNSAAKSRNLTNIFMLILLAICFFSIN